MNGSSHYCKNINSPLTKIRIKHDYNQISKMIFFLEFNKTIPKFIWKDMFANNQKNSK